MANAPLKCRTPIEKLIHAIARGDIVPRGTLTGETGLSALIVAVGNLTPLITKQVRSAPYRKRGPYKKKSD
ncbi:hypothetical protein [Methylobacterium sp. WL69]|uniref:hypothetical protein n=1 Tax=Methylobacterium sp. WL69 TaxID=2603893 RepID=UPI00164EF67D|nr:hypothetical protein [Methylobacterium sp. WL69]